MNGLEICSLDDSPGAAEPGVIPAVCAPRVSLLGL